MGKITSFFVAIAAIVWGLIGILILTGIVVLIAFNPLQKATNLISTFTESSQGGPGGLLGSFLGGEIGGAIKGNLQMDPSNIPPEVIQCAEGILGKKRVAELQGGGKEPTASEMQKVIKCFQK